MKARFTLLISGLLMALNLQAHVALLNPSGGETFVPGEIVNIQWEILITHNTLNWDLYLSEDGGTTWEALELDISVDSLSFQWTVPDMPTTEAKIRVVMDNGGNNYMDNSDNFTITTVTGIENNPNKISYRLYPNPMVESATITFENPGNESLNLMMYNSKGQLVNEIKGVTSDRFLVNRNNLESGLYYFRILSGNEIKVSGKLLME